MIKLALTDLDNTLIPTGAPHASLHAIAAIHAMIERGDYFCINRARQFGKTTLLAALRRTLAGVFAVASLDFQALSHASFHTEGHFVRAICRMEKEPGLKRVAIEGKTLWEETL